MKKAKSSVLKVFKRDDKGHVTIEFVLIFPIFMIIMVSAVELGIMTLRYAFLERSLDVVVRDVRLNTGATPDHDTLRDAICEQAAIIPDCANNLRLEMRTRDVRNWQAMPDSRLCTNRAEEAEAVTDENFQPGAENELMVLRACVKMKPLFPTTGLGAAFEKDAAGDLSLMVSNAFVQEPR